MTRLSRRAFVTASAATIAGTGLAAVPLVARAEPSADASLLAMGREWADLFFNELPARIKANDEALTRFKSMESVFPAALIKTERDAELSLCGPFNVCQEYDLEFIERFQSKPRVRPVHRKPRPGEGGREWGAHDLIVEREPWPEAQARADEIVATWKKYLADDAAACDASGYSAADDAHWDTVSRMTRLEARIAQTTATTLDGLLVKARVAAAAVDTVGGVSAEIDAMIGRRDAPSDYLALSVVRDLIAMNARAGV